MTRSPEKATTIAALGATPVVCDIFDATALVEAVVGFAPDLVMHQLTDLPDHLDELSDYTPRNNRIRTEGTRNLLAAAPTIHRLRLGFTSRMQLCEPWRSSTRRAASRWSPTRTESENRQLQRQLLAHLAE